mgnify:CR=1 FL=1
MEWLILKGEKGTALITALIMLVILTLIGIVAINTSTTEIQIASNMRGSKVSFSEAEGGVEAGMRWLLNIYNSGASHPANNVGNPLRVQDPLNALNQGYLANQALGAGNYTYRIVSLDAPAPDGYRSFQPAQIKEGGSAKKQTPYGSSSNTYFFYYQINTTGNGPFFAVTNIEQIAAYIGDF